MEEPRAASARERARVRAEALRERTPEYVDWARERVPGAETALGAWDRERRAAGVLIAGGLAFRFFLWLVPLGLAGAVVLSFWGDYAPDTLEETARELGVGATATQSAIDAVQTSDSNRIVLLLVALGLTAWFSLGAVRALTLAFALAWKMERPKVRRPLVAIGLFDGVFLAVTLGSVGLAWLREEIGLGGLLGLLATFALATALVLVVLWFLPHRAEHPRELLPGALLIAIGTELIQLAVVFYFAPKLERSSELYGSLGTAAALLLWLYVTARLLTAAAFVNATLWERRQQRAEPAHAASSPAELTPQASNE